MTDMNTGIDLIERLDSLIADVIDKFDIIAPIARKGIRVLELSKYSSQLFEQGRILYIDFAQFHPLELKNKKILLFDESVRTGKSLVRSKNTLDNLSKRKRLGLKVSTAALIILDEVEQLPTFRKDDLIVGHNLYDILSDELSNKILSNGIPFDIDHPIIALRLEEEAISNLLEHLNKVTPTIELWHSGCFGDVRMFTAEYKDNFPLPQIEGYPSIMDEGPKKVRLFLKGNILHCVPIIYPCLNLSDDAFKLHHNCKLKVIYGKESFCKVLDLKEDLDEDNFEFRSALCYSCIVTELNIRLIGHFLNKLKGYIKFEFVELQKRDLIAMYHMEGEILGKIIEKKIKTVMDGDDLPLISNKIAEKCYFKKIHPIKRRYLLNKIRSEIKVSMIVSQYASENLSLFKYGDYSTSEQPIGLSYSQISSIMEALKESNFSEGMDIALDIGLLKPTITYKGVDINYKNSSIRGVARLYCLGSEDVDKSLKFFNKILAK